MDRLTIINDFKGLKKRLRRLCKTARDFQDLQDLLDSAYPDISKKEE